MVFLEFVWIWRVTGPFKKETTFSFFYHRNVWLFSHPEGIQRTVDRKKRKISFSSFYSLPLTHIFFVDLENPLKEKGMDGVGWGLDRVPFRYITHHSQPLPLSFPLINLFLVASFFASLPPLLIIIDLFLSDIWFRESHGFQFLNFPKHWSIR